MKAKKLLEELQKMLPQDLELPLKVVTFSGSDPVVENITGVSIRRTAEEREEMSKKPFIWLDKD